MAVLSAGRTILNAAPEIGLFLAIAIGHLVGKFRLGSFQLGGIAGSLLAAVALSQIGVPIQAQVGTVLFALFIYAVGVQSGPQFFQSLGRHSLKEVALAAFLAASALVTVIVVARVWHLDKGLAAGIAAGGLTQSAIIGTAGAALAKLGLPLAEVQQLQGNVAVGYAVTYLFGSLGPIILCVSVLPWMMKRNLRQDALKAEAAQTESVHVYSGEDGALPHLVGRVYRVDTPVPVGEIEKGGVYVERVQRKGKIRPARPENAVHDDDHLGPLSLLAGDLVLLVGPREKVVAAGAKLGPEVPAPDGMNVPMVKKEVMLTHRAFFGKPLSACIALLPPSARHVYILAVERDGKPLPLSADSVAKDGDLITFYGTGPDVQRIAAKVGFAVPQTNATDLIYHGFGLALGLLVGWVVVRVHGVPLTLGAGGGALLSGLIFGWYHGRHPTVGAMPPAASALLVNLGLSGFVAVIGLRTGQEAIATIEAHGLLIFFLGILVTLVPLILTILFGYYVLRYRNAALFAGALAGARSANPALGAVLASAGNAVPTTPFAITYAIANVLLTLLGPLIVAFA